MGGGAENALVYGAPTLTHEHIEDQYINPASKSRRIGMAVSNIIDDDDEQKVFHQIEAIDAWMGSFVEDGQSANTFSLNGDLSLAYHLDEYKRYVDPITGQWATPDRSDQPGPSCRIHDVSSASSGSQISRVEDTYRSLDSVPLYPRLPPLIESTERHNFARSARPSQRESSPNPRTRTTKSTPLGSNSGGPLLNQTRPTEEQGQASLNGKRIERSVQWLEEESRSMRWNQPLNNHNVASQGEDYTGPRLVSDIRRVRHSEGRRQNQNEQDRRCAVDLTGDILKDHAEPLEAEASGPSEERRRMQAAEDETDRLDQEEMQALFEPIRRLQLKLDLEANSGIRRDVAPQSTTREERNEKSKTQAEDDRRREEDLLLAQALYEIENEMALELEWSAQVSIYAQRQPRRAGSFEWLKRQLRLAVDHLRAPVSPSIFHSRRNVLAPRGPNSDRLSQPRAAIQGERSGGMRSSGRTGYASGTPGRRRAPAADLDTISASLQGARNLQNTRRQEIRRSEGATRHAQEEAGRKQRQAHRGMEHLRRGGGQQSQVGQRGEQEPGRTRPASTAGCSACMEHLPTDQMCRLGCEHYYCRPCLETAIQTAVKDKRAFRCCSRQAEPDVVGQWLPARVDRAYAAVVEELSTPNPTYCHGWRCSAFIPTTHYVGDTALCPRCPNVTCRLCKQKAHGQVICEQDAAGQAVLALSRTRRWMRCPHCQTMVERYSGCLHMTCTCGTQFCYNCGKPRWRCRGSKCVRR